MFAVIKAGGKQYRVAEDQVLKVEGVEGEPGTIVQIGEVIMLGGDKPQLGNPTISGASVAAEIIEHGRGPKVIAFKKRRRKNSRRKRGHRQDFVLIRISEILMDGAKPSKGQAEAEARAEGEKAEGRRDGRLSRKARATKRNGREGRQAQKIASPDPSESSVHQYL